jgi:hypothetical protein
MDAAALREFASHLVRGGLVLDASRSGGLGLLTEMGFKTESVDPQADLRLLSLPREQFDGVWVHQSLFKFTADECRRAMASFFYTLKSGGILFVSFEMNHVGESGPFVEDDYASLIRQHGFSLLTRGKEEKHPERVAFVARRI